MEKLRALEKIDFLQNRPATAIALHFLCMHDSGHTHQVKHRILRILRMPFFRNERMPINVRRYLHLDLSKHHVVRNISRFRLRAHTLKVEAAAWLEDGSCVCDQCPGEDEHVQNEVHAILIFQDHRDCELRKHFSLQLTPFFEDFSAAQPFLLQQVNNQLVHDFLSQQNNRLLLFLSDLMDLIVAGRDQSAADQPNNLAEGPPPL